MPSDKRQRQRENQAARAAAARAAATRRKNRRRGLIGGLAIVAVVAIIALLVSQSTGSNKTTLSATATTVAGGTTTVASAPAAVAPAPDGASITGPTPCPNLDGSSPRTTHFAQAPPSCIDPGKHWTATFDTTEGNITVALDTTRTAGTVNNFIVLALYHYYDKTSFDRIDTSIDIIQGGSPSQSIADPGPGYTIHDEGGAFTTDSSGQLHGPFSTYSAGDLVMARGSGANSGAAQYFFVAGPNGNNLGSQGTYVTFGHVSQGLDVLQKVEKLYVPCPAGSQTCLGGGPSKAVIVNAITISSS